MDISRPSTPEAPPQDLWSSILDSVSSSRSIPPKQVLILGQPSTGKSTIASALLQKPVSDEEKDESRSDFAIGYDFVDVRDDADEGEFYCCLARRDPHSTGADTLARLSVYTIPSSSSSYTSLLPHFLPPRLSLPHTVVLIVLDWTRPWAFVEELQTWLQWIETWSKGDGSHDVEVVREENRERCACPSLHQSCSHADHPQCNLTYNITPNLQWTHCPRIQPFLGHYCLLAQER